MPDRGARRLFFLSSCDRRHGTGLTRLIEAEAAYRAGVRVIQTSEEIERYRVDVIA